MRKLQPHHGQDQLNEKSRQNFMVQLAKVEQALSKDSAVQR